MSSITASGHGALHDRIAALSAQLLRTPDDAALYFALADVYARHDETTLSLAAIEQVERLAPDQFSTRLVRARALMADRRFDEARKSLNAFLASHPDHPDALLQRARCTAALGDTVASLTDFDRLAALATPPDLVSAAEAADAFAIHGDATRALTILRDAIANHGNDPALVRRAFAIEANTGRYDDALAHLDVLQRLAPQPEPWMAERATLLGRAGRIDAARVSWEALLAHISALPNLERGTPAMRALTERARTALLSHSPRT